MRTRSLIIRAVSVIALVTTASACDKSPTEVTNSDVTVSIAVSRTAFRHDEGTIVRVTTTNRGNTPIVIAPTDCQIPFEVSRGTTTIVSAQNIPCIGILPWRAIKPGESAVDERTWHGSDWNWAVELKAGNYELRGKIFVGDQPVVSTPVSVNLLSP